MTQHITTDTIPSFEEIAPYSDSEFHQMMAELVTEPGFEHAVKYVMPDADYPKFAEQLLTIHSQNEFQTKVMWPFLEMLASKTTSGVSMGGLDNISPEGHYTFITNHRDIVLDASFLNLEFLRHNRPTTEIAIGNNLLIYEWISKLVKLNKSFIVKRDVKKIEALKAARQLSGYIHWAIKDKGASIWIAQREGRAKDSNDLTQESLIKMLALAGNGNVRENLIDINLVPAAITYEYDPNDYLKAREFLMKKRNPDFHKSQRDDLFAMETGLLQPKGRVHVELGTCINDLIAAIPADTDKNHTIKEVSHIIDTMIHGGYRLYPINYIAYDRIHHTPGFTSMYSEEEVETVDKYLSGQLEKVENEVNDVTSEEREFMLHKMLEMYANPLKNKIRATNII